MESLEQAEIDRLLKTLPEWTQSGDALQRTFKFGDFVASMSFVNKVATLAEQLQHHPDILVRYNKVTLTVTTHDAGGLTSKDFDLATKCDAMAAKASAPAAS
jgi:4a-hydroxytetrahydrobiopterin dehydratase